MSRPVVADFNHRDERGRYWLYDDELADAARGERVVLTDGEVSVDAVLDFDDGRGVWLGDPCVCCFEGFYCRHRCPVHPKPNGPLDSGKPWVTA